jgi:hypothetical protein
LFYGESVDLTERVTEVERQLAEQRAELARGAARLRGLEAELEALRGGDTDGDLATAPRTDAIVAVLRGAEGTLSPSEILERLHAAGRSDELRSVTATLDHLVKKSAVHRPARGRYLAT